MDESALRMAIANFEASLSSFHFWLEFFTVLVVLGVICEVAFVVLEFREDLHDFRRGIVHPPDKPSVLLLVFGLFAASLVAVGVAGEFWEDAQIDGAETQIRTANDKLYLLLSNEAGDAARSAKTAHDEANAVKGIADASKKDAEDALAKAQTAQRELARSEDDAAKAQTAASNALRTASQAEQVARDTSREVTETSEELNRIKAPRSLVNSDEMISALKPFNGTEYTLNVFMDDESIQFTKVVAGALEAAGWVRKQPPGINLGVPTVDIVFDQAAAEHVPSCLDTGISLHVYVKEPLAVLQSLPLQSLPKTLQAGLILKSVIAPNISPPDERNVASGVVDPKPAENVPITICVGKKP